MRQENPALTQPPPTTSASPAPEETRPVIEEVGVPETSPPVAEGDPVARGAWRRGMSRLISERALREHRDAPLLRLGLHPVDMRHGFSRAYWLDLLQRLLADGRVPTTKIDWLQGRLRAASAAA